MFNFNFAKAKISNKTYKPKQINNIVERNAVGVIHISSTAFYYVNIHNKQYLLTKESYSCKNKTILFAKELINGKILKRIDLEECSREDMTYYLPFSVGTIVQGNIIKNGNVELFDIKKNLYFIPEYEEERKGAIKTFIKNYQTLGPIIKNRIHNEFTDRE